MKTSRSPLLAALLCSLLLAPAAHAEAPAALTSIGFLNGMALACQQPALVARLREAVVAYAPKQREVGEAFEQATNLAYLGYSNGGGVCPDGRTLAERVDGAILELKAAYAPAR